MFSWSLIDYLACNNVYYTLQNLLWLRPLARLAPNCTNIYGDRTKLTRDVGLPVCWNKTVVSAVCVDGRNKQTLLSRYMILHSIPSLVKPWGHKLLRLVLRNSSWINEKYCRTASTSSDRLYSKTRLYLSHLDLIVGRAPVTNSCYTPLDAEAYQVVTWRVWIQLAYILFKSVLPVSSVQHDLPSKSVVTVLLRRLHWLPVSQWIAYKVAL